ncbi:MAG TPA: transcription initiation factor IIB family protein [Thermoplasmata archaeon]|nr:transcription initiation factor IIB family protein [Thermoplasmata archaeon]
MDENLCSECAGPLVFDGFEFACSACGLVNEVRLLDDREPFRTDDDGAVLPGSHGPPTQAGVAPSGSVIAFGDRDARGNRLPDDPVSRTRLSRMRRAASYGATLKERSHREMERAIHAIGSRLGIAKSIRERAVELGRKNGGSARGKPWALVASALLLLASREVGSGLKARDFVAVSVNDKGNKRGKRAGRGGRSPESKKAHRILREFRLLNRTLNVNVRSSAEDFVPKFVSDLRLPSEVAMKALELIRLAPLHAGRSPTVAASGGIYAAALVMGHRVGQRAVGKAAGCSEVSVRSALAEMCETSEAVRKIVVEANTRGRLG